VLGKIHLLNTNVKSISKSEVLLTDVFEIQHYINVFCIFQNTVQNAKFHSGKDFFKRRKQRGSNTVIVNVIV